MKTSRLSSSERISFWFPVILPVVVGLVYGFTELASNIGATAVVISLEIADVDIKQLLMWDAFSLWEASSEGIVISMFSVHIWALSTMFSSTFSERSLAAYAYPVIGIFTNFLLVSLVVGAIQLVGALAESGKFAAQVLSIQIIASITVIFAVIVGWYVRRGVWLYHELELPSRHDLQDSR